MSLLQMSFSGAVMILAIIIVRAIAMNKLPKRTFLLLWGLVLIRLLIPFSIPSTFSVYSLLDRNTTVQDVIAETPVENMIPQTITEPLDISGEVMQAVQNDAVVAGDMISISVWSVVWSVGVIVCAGYFVITYLCCLFEFQTSLPVVNVFISEWLKEHQLRRQIKVRQSGRISTPLTYGILHPVILLPKNTEWENTEQLQYILLHEYTHICRFDMILKLIATCALCIHWFNPLVWAMYVLFNQDVELACDDSVVRQFGEQSRASYAQTLIAMEAKKSGLTPLFSNFSKNATEERIVAIMKNKKVTASAVAISILILAIVVVLFATSADSESAAGGGDASEIEATDAGKDLGEFEVPDVVAETANAWVAQCFGNIESDNYLDWRVESLEYAYTYDDFDGMTLQVYRMNYEYLIADPEQILLAGGMSIDEEGWLVPEYPNCTYLIFEQVGDELSYLTTLMENDCEAGDELFTNDLRTRLENENSQISETAEDYYQVATSTPASDVEAFALEIKNDVLTKDWEALSKKIVYPITISGTTVNDSSEFLELDIDEKLNQEFLDAIANETCREMFCNWQGISMGATGQIWFASVDTGTGVFQMKIIGINEMLDAQTDN
ncbi:MAG: M56 family metallopeptidase [Roseburia sp.]|nr:M56 family metallopeptidase [Roseburia sp.]